MCIGECSLANLAMRVGIDMTACESHHVGMQSAGSFFMQI